MNQIQFQLPTRQEAFDRALTHLRQQGQRAIGGRHDACRYRTGDGLKCAVGALIPDEHYDPEFEGYRANHVFQRLGLELTHDDADFYRNLQLDLHDRIRPYQGPFLDVLERNAKGFADQYGLEYHHA